MTDIPKSKTAVVIPNWNGAKSIIDCLKSLKTQTETATIIVVDNGSIDSSINLIEQKFSSVKLIKHPKNYGFAGGVNAGIRLALAEDYEYIALLNNDAVAEPDWLAVLVAFLSSHPGAGIVTSKIVSVTGKLDSTGELYSIWGLPFPRGRDKTDLDQYDDQTWIFGASGGASLYRADMFRQIGLFDEDFFAYYEDVDISFRAQLAGWKIGFEPKAIIYHQIGATSRTIPGFAAYQTLKNLPLLMWKNVPWALMPKVWPRLTIAYLFIAGRALLRGQFGPFFRGTAVSLALLPKKWLQRYHIQKTRKASTGYISSIITYDLPPNATKLRKLRSLWWVITRRQPS